MSNRFYVNGVQIFGNNEMFDCTYKELERQGAQWDEDGVFNEIQITDPQGLMEAVQTDTLEYLRRITTENVFDYEKNAFIKHKSFNDVHDSDLILSAIDPDYLKSCAYTDDGMIHRLPYLNFKYWIESKRIFTSYVLYTAIKDDVDLVKGKLVLKQGHKITAEMY